MNTKFLVIAKFGTIKAFAEQTGVTRQYMTDVLNGHRTPGKKLAIRMSKALGGEVSTAEILQLPEAA